MNARKNLFIFICLCITLVFYLTPDTDQRENNNNNIKSEKPIVFIFGLGGSGTRGVTALLHSWGCTNVSQLNFALDNVFFHNSLDDYIFEIADRTHSANYHWDDLLPYLKERIQNTMQEGMKLVKEAQKENECVVIKAPRIIYMLPVMHQFFPSAKYIQVIRDARDMAFSDNLGQLHTFGRYFLTLQDRRSLNAVIQQVRFWFLVNMQAKHYLRKMKEEDYMILNIESLVLQQEEEKYRKLWQTIFGKFGKKLPREKLSKNSIFTDSIGAEGYNNTHNYGKYKYITTKYERDALSAIESNYKTELEEFGYFVPLPSLSL